MQTNATGQVVLKLKTPWCDCNTHLAMLPLEFMQRLAALVPRSRQFALGCWCDASGGRVLRGDHSIALSVHNGSRTGLREQLLTGPTMDETGLPECGYSPLAANAAMPPVAGPS